MHVFGDTLTPPRVFASEKAYRLAVASAFTEVPKVPSDPDPGPGKGRGPGRGFGLGRLLGRDKVPAPTDEVTRGARTSWERYNGWEPPGRVVALASGGARLDTGSLLTGHVLVTTKDPKASKITGPDLRPGGALEPMFGACVQCFSVEKWAQLGFGTSEDDIVNARAFVAQVRLPGTC
jgi:hypothetical protein